MQELLSISKPAMYLLPDCTSLVQLCLVIHPSIWPLSIFCGTGAIVCSGQQWLCFLIQKVPYRRGLYHHHRSCFANRGNRKRSNCPSDDVDEHQQATEPSALLGPVVTSSDVSVTKQISPVSLWKGIYYKTLKNPNNPFLCADRASLAAVTDNHVPKLLASRSRSIVSAEAIGLETWHKIVSRTGYCSSTLLLKMAVPVLSARVWVREMLSYMVPWTESELWPVHFFKSSFRFCYTILLALTLSWTEQNQKAFLVLYFYFLSSRVFFTSLF